MVSTGPFGRALCLAVDARQYGRADDRLQAEWQEGLLAALDEAAGAADLDRPKWTRQPKGDEELALLPDNGSEPRVVDDFVHALDRVLDAYNRTRASEKRLRLRVALHHGVAFAGANGMPGQAVVLVSRLLNSEPAHQALEVAPRANLALIVSARIYEDVVLQPHTCALRPEDFRKVVVREKEVVTEGWLRVPGYNVQQLDLSARSEETPRRRKATGKPGKSTVSNTFQGDVEASHANFGVIENFGGAQ